MKILLFWEKIVKFYAKIARNWKILSVCIFVGGLVQRFALWYFIALLNTQAILSSCIGQDFAFWGKKVKFCAKFMRNWKILSVSMFGNEMA